MQIYRDMPYEDCVAVDEAALTNTDVEIIFHWQFVLETMRAMEIARFLQDNFPSCHVKITVQTDCKNHPDNNL